MAAAMAVAGNHAVPSVRCCCLTQHSSFDFCQLLTQAYCFASTVQQHEQYDSHAIAAKGAVPSGRCEQHVAVLTLKAGLGAKLQFVHRGGVWWGEWGGVARVRQGGATFHMDFWSKGEMV